MERFGLTSLDDLPPLDVEIAERLATEAGGRAEGGSRTHGGLRTDGPAAIEVDLHG